MVNPTTFFARKEIINGTKVLTFDCIPGCGKTHTHGYGEGHRTAHCDCHENGYFLKEAHDEENS